MHGKRFIAITFGYLVIACVSAAAATDPTGFDEKKDGARGVGATPLTITKGGTYSGHWMSSNPDIAAVTISTSDPVVIKDSTITSKGSLILVKSAGAHVRVENVNGRALDPGIEGKARGRFLYAYKASDISVLHCTMTGVSFGVLIDGSTLTNLHISNNIANDMEDRASDGHGGFLNKRAGLGHFIQIGKSVAVNGADISWNQVIDTPGKSSVEDVMNIYLTHAASKDQPIRIHDNYIQGMSSPANSNNNYTGSGIMMDGASDDLQTATGFVNIDNNQIVHTGNVGIGVNAGHDIHVANNIVVSCGKESGGNWMATTSAQAIEMWNEYHSKVYSNNSISGTSGGLVRPNKTGTAERADGWTPAVSATTGNAVDKQAFSDPCAGEGGKSLAPEAQEYEKWMEKMKRQSITVGSTVK